jgi:hypothetical protein
MKILIQILIAILLLITGFAAGFPAGKSAGFTSGSEWALVQAKIVAREAGVFMPVSLYEGQIRVVIKQPRHIYKRAWELADRNEEEMRRVNSGIRPLSETVLLAQAATMMQ